MGEALTEGYTALAQAAGQAGGFTDDGKNWLIKAMDPFHDVIVDLKGFPDAYAGKTITQEVKQSTTFGNPFETPTDGWSVMIVSTGFLTACTQYSAAKYDSLYKELIIPKDGSGFPLLGSVGGITIIPRNTGSTTYFPTQVDQDWDTVGVDCWHLLPGGAVIADTNFSDNINTANAAYCNGNLRCISHGFEVHNVTSELYKGGTATVFRMPKLFDSEVFTGLMANGQDTGGTQEPVQTPKTTMQNTTGWPSTVGDALLLPMTRQWTADQGAYCTAVFDAEDNDFENYQTSNIFNFVNSIPRIDWTNVPYSGTTVETTRITPTITTWNNNTMADGPRGDPPTDFTFVSYSQPMIKAHYYPFGVIFSGLSKETQLTLNARWVLEMAPGFGDPFLTLAKPCASYDQNVLQAYGKATQFLPPGVPVKENPLGEWFMKAMDILSAVAAPVATAAFGPIGGQVAGLAANVWTANRKRLRR